MIAEVIATQGNKCVFYKKLPKIVRSHPGLRYINQSGKTAQKEADFCYFLHQKMRWRA